MTTLTTRTDTMTRDAAVAMALALGLGAAVGGPAIAAQAFVCAAVASVNLLVFRFLVERTTSDLAAGGDGGLSGSLLAGKLVATLAVVVVGLQFVQPVAIAIGLALVLGVTALTGTVHSLTAEGSA